MLAGKQKKQQARPGRTRITTAFENDSAQFLQRFPWHKPLEEWNRSEANFLQIKSGLSRHLVRFVRVRRKSFAIKETSAETALREFAAYSRLRQMKIPTLLPVGTVIRDEGDVAVETEIGKQIEHHETGYIVTQLLEFAIPNYFLFRRAFTKTNRARIWDTIIRLFVELHIKGVYWGDASLSNMMIVFAKEEVPEIGLRTVLRALLADAETVEFYPKLSMQMRIADIENFLESMAWTEADMRSSGLLRDPLLTTEDQKYILNRYRDLFAVEQEALSFELITKIDIDKLLGTFQVPGQSKALLQHIYEHKWYLSERKGNEIAINEAAHDWYINVFKPVIGLFAKHAVLDEFPDRTASSLYLDIMLHKYYLSEQIGSDVGLLAALESYARKFKDRTGTMEKMLALSRSVRKLLVG